MSTTIEARSSAGTEYGHVPGHTYHDVDVTITRRANGRWRVAVCETWGSAQGYDEEHGRREVVGRGDTLDRAVEDAKHQAIDAGIETQYLTRALSMAADEAEEGESHEQ